MSKLVRCYDHIDEYFPKWQLGIFSILLMNITTEFPEASGQS